MTSRSRGQATRCGRYDRAREDPPVQNPWSRVSSVIVAALTLSCSAWAEQGGPNVLVIFGDDIGITNVSAYSDGLMGYDTPSIDRIGDDGIRFLHYYGEQSCTAGRAAFLTGQHGIRTGLTKVGFP